MSFDNSNANTTSIEDLENVYEPIIGGKIFILDV